MPKRKSSIPPTTTIDEPFEPDLGRAFDLVMKLMPIPGKTGQEQEVADCIIKYLRDAGAPAGAARSEGRDLFRAGCGAFWPDFGFLA